MAEITNQNPGSEAMATKGGGVEGGGANDQRSQVRHGVCCVEMYNYIKVSNMKEEEKTSKLRKSIKVNL